MSKSNKLNTANLNRCHNQNCESLTNDLVSTDIVLFSDRTSINGNETKTGIQEKICENEGGSNNSSECRTLKSKPKPRQKPAIEIYRPPNLRSESNCPTNSKLNANAKEFVMRSKLFEPKSDEIIFNCVKNKQSKSGGNLCYEKRHLSSANQLSQQRFHNQCEKEDNHHKKNSINESGSQVALSETKSVHFKLDKKCMYSNRHTFCKNASKPKKKASWELRRSKSTGTANIDLLSQELERLEIACADHKNSLQVGLGFFATNDQVQNALIAAMDGKDSRTMNRVSDLVETLVAKACEHQCHAASLAKICVSLLLKSQTSTFPDSLASSCWNHYNQLVNKSINPKSLSFIPFMWFLTEICQQIKLRNLNKKCALKGYLAILIGCCQALIEPPVGSLSEMECLFYVMTCAGSDLEQEQPLAFERLWTKIRDSFLCKDTSPHIKKTLLQLIEFRASKWHLSSATASFYYAYD